MLFSKDENFYYRIRDVHLVLKSLSTDVKKETLIEIKWDANRDPTEKVYLHLAINSTTR